jgi:hypothetical protein
LILKCFAMAVMPCKCFGFRFHHISRLREIGQGVKV